MTTAYLDESGDLGFDFTKPGTSRRFLVTTLVCADDRAVEKTVRRVYAGMSQTDKKHHHGVLHAYSLRPATRRRLLQELAALDVSIFAILLDKRQDLTGLSSDSHVLYGSLTGAILDQVRDSEMVTPDEPLRLVASRRETKRLLNNVFIARLREHAEQISITELVVDVADPSSEKGLQAVDCVSWSLFRHYEYGDSTYADLIRAKVVMGSGALSRHKP